MEHYVVAQGVRAAENFARALLGSDVIHDEIDALVLRQIANDFRVDPWNGLELSRPVVFEMGPCEPSGGVRFPLGGETRFGFGWHAAVSTQHSALSISAMQGPCCCMGE